MSDPTTTALRLAPLLFATSTLSNDIMELIGFNTLLQPPHRRQVASILPTYVPAWAQGLTLYHVPLHLLHVSSIIAVTNLGPPLKPGLSRWYYAALALEIAHFVVFAAPVIPMIKGIEAQGKEPKEGQTLGLLEKLASLQTWRMWVVNVPCMICCLVPVLI
jgi:hypothetical protein